MALIICVDHGCVAAMQISIVHRLILGFKVFKVLHWMIFAALSTDDTLDCNLLTVHGRAFVLVHIS